MLPKGLVSNCIKRFILGVLVAVGLLFAFYAYASSNNLFKPHREGFAYLDETSKPEDNVLYRPSEDVIEAARIAHEEALRLERLRQAKSLAQNKTGYWQTQCVYYAKQLTGVWGTWGNGGKYLSANSGPVVGAVIVFYGTHVGVITAIDGNTITYTDRNYDLKGTIRQSVTIQIGDPKIWKYHLF